MQGDGQIGIYKNFNETYWKINNNKLFLLNANMEKTSEFTYDENSGAWFGYVIDTKWPMYLFPIIKVNVKKELRKKAILINSIPKSGTYFLESIIHDCKYIPTKLHVSSNDIIHDNRCVIKENIHFNPGSRYIKCDLSSLSKLLSNTQTVTVGHIEDKITIDSFINNDFVVISVVRNLRDVLVSLMRFKEKIVKPRSPADTLWHSLEGSDKLIGFISYYHESDIQHIKQVTQNILNYPETIIKYEELLSNKFNSNLLHEIGNIETLHYAIKNNINKNNSTFSGNRSNYLDFWNDNIEEYFETSGLKALNLKLGYN
ncbi:sulfotransferase domain-containing protein [Aliivibrio fischeri]|uniref:sulfotransferase domain-containing protein n=1 Tax=Aliivibrio fischeri TaxID=668 RepID=UPI00084C82B2|nr:sulfotransferase domain-containing protein [Aliivibrio fischeri]OED55532.1 hypothetical protein BEI47_14920 [Aliivibrio fischeri]